MPIRVRFISVAVPIFLAATPNGWVGTPQLPTLLKELAWADIIEPIAAISVASGSSTWSRLASRDHFSYASVRRICLPPGYCVACHVDRRFLHRCGVVPVFPPVVGLIDTYDSRVLTSLPNHARC